MRAVSLFSGVGGFEIGLGRAGIETVLQVENDPWCLNVLARHWPDVARVTDVRRVCVGEPAERSPADGLRSPVDIGWRQARAGIPSDIDLVYGGFPCQDVSVAGKRAGLSGERSGLWYEFERILSELRPRWALIENVPGLLSSNAGRDFGFILRGMDDLGYGIAWRVLDARFFGVPQRRRRVFIVGCLGDAARAAQVLAVCESCGGHPQARGEAWKTTPAETDDGAQGFSEPADPISAHEGKTYTHEGKNNFRLHNVINGVRRLTPLECERLQGFPDGHTQYTADGKLIPDSHRYRMIGNGVVATVAEWIGHRLMASMNTLIGAAV